MATKPLSVRNTSTNRIILGGGKGVPMVTLGGKDDASKDGVPVDGAPRLSRVLEPERAARFRKGPMGALAERLGLQFA